MSGLNTNLKSTRTRLHHRETETETTKNWSPDLYYCVPHIRLQAHALVFIA